MFEAHKQDYTMNFVKGIQLIIENDHCDER